LFATSSSKLKRTNQEPTDSSPSPTTTTTTTTTPSVVKRLSQAAEQAKKSLSQAEEKEHSVSGKFRSKGTPPRRTPKKLGSLQNLTAAIEAKLDKSRKLNLNSPNRDAMAEVLRHNEDSRPKVEAVKHVAILLTKPLQNDRVTVENANRIRKLVHTMIQDGYRPSVICFVGPQYPGNLVADADASYLFFQELCAAKKVPVHGIDIHLVKGSVEDGALDQISYFLKETCSPLWNRELEKEPGAADHLHVHFTLVSSEYELCQLNDINDRSPGRSPLRALSSWSSRSFRTSWSYVYSTTILPPDESDDVMLMFRAKTYRSGQELMPVLQHMRGVAENREFFQLEAYRVLVAARRSIVKDMEMLYHRPKNHIKSEEAMQDEQQPIDVTLEAALLSLGRCLDLVRPAGKGGGVVPAGNWALAAVLLEKAISQILCVCDTDHPLDPSEWGRMGDE
jgi:hypothetical protein